MSSMQPQCGQRRVAIIGATGSIGRQTADIIANHPEMYRATVLTAGRRVDDLIMLAKKLRPAIAIIGDESRYATLANALQPLGIETAAGSKAIAEACGRDDVDMVLNANVGYSGLEPTLRAIDAGKDLALANKESLVVAGELVNFKLLQSPTRLYPVDSEHSAIYQCLQGEDPAAVNRLLITASGGPFRTLSLKELRHVTAAQALKHPNWSMGPKITIDSATMLNKAFEIIEARWLFDMPAERIKAVVHPQSIVHSMVEFVDGAIKAQLGAPDMHLPIAYALGCAHRLPKAERQLSIADYAALTFEEPDLTRFPCLGLAAMALHRRGNTACIINAANEVAVDAFLKGRIGFLDIYRVIVDTLDATPYIAAPQYDDYVATNTQARVIAERLTTRATGIQN